MATGFFFYEKKIEFVIKHLIHDGINLARSYGTFESGADRYSRPSRWEDKTGINR